MKPYRILARRSVIMAATVSLLLPHASWAVLTLEIDTAAKTATLKGSDSGRSVQSTLLQTGVVWQRIDDLGPPSPGADVMFSESVEPMWTGLNQGDGGRGNFTLDYYDLEDFPGFGSHSGSFIMRRLEHGGTPGVAVTVTGTGDSIDYSSLPPQGMVWLEGLIGSGIPVLEGEGFSPIAIVAATNTPPAPLLHLPLDGHTCDVSGNGHHGTASAGLTFAPGAAGGAANGAAVFTGSEKIDFDEFAIDASEFTITGFISTSSTAPQAIVGLGSGSGTIAALQVSNSPVSGNLRFIDRPGGGGAGGISVFSPNAYSDGAFHHFAIRKSGTTSSLFVDGALVRSGTGTAGTFSGLTDFVIGQNAPDSPTRHFVGSIDDIRVYGVALSDAQIGDLAVASTAAPARTFRITAFSRAPGTGTVDLTFTSYAGVEYAFETSPDGRTWTQLPGAPITGGAGTTSVTGLALPTPVPDKLLLRVRCVAGS